MKQRLRYPTKEVAEFHPATQITTKEGTISTLRTNADNPL